MSKRMKKDDPLYDAKVQKILNKLISEEFIANSFYVGCIAACDNDARMLLNDMFAEIAVDELSDHCHNLVCWAQCNGYSVPYKLSDYEKHASKTCVKLLDGLKNDQEAGYYVDQAIKSEQDAIASYEEALKYDDLPQDLNAMLIQIRYEELEHLENLNTLKLAVDGQVDLVNW